MQYVDEVLLDAIASQARFAYAMTQLAACQAALQLWRHRADQWTDEYSAARINHEVAYYTQQVTRWQGYLAELGPVPQIIPAFT